MLEAGVRYLTIHADCTFSNNTEYDILYGDSEKEDDDEYFMRFHDNEYLGTSASIDSKPFDLGNEETGYVANKLENLQ
jgi:hypothetical protein